MLTHPHSTEAPDSLVLDCSLPERGNSRRGIELDRPVIALDAASTIHHENALLVTRIESGYRVILAVLDPLSAECFAPYKEAKIPSRYEWERVRHSLYCHESAGDPSNLSLGDKPERSLLVKVDLAHDGVTVLDTEISCGTDTIAKQYLYSDLASVASRDDMKVLQGSERDLVAIAELGLKLFIYRRRRGDVLFADVERGLVLQPDGSWESYPSQEILGRVAVQEITSLVGAALADWGSKQQIPLLYRGCSAASPEAQAKLSSLLKGERVSREAIDDILIDPKGRRIRLFHRGSCEIRPIPHAGMQSSSYLRATAPLRVFQDFINVQQLLSHSLGEPTPYTISDLAHFAEQINFRSDRKVRSKGVRKYRDQIHPSIKALEEGPFVDTALLRTTVANCRDMGEIPSGLIDYLVRNLKGNFRTIAPIIMDLTCSREFENSPNLRKAVRQLFHKQPYVVDGLIEAGIKTGSIKEEHIRSYEDSGSRIFEIVWKVGGKVIYSQRPFPSDRDKDQSLKNIRHTQFARLIDPKVYGTSTEPELKSEFPNLRKLVANLESRDIWTNRIITDTNVFGDGLWEATLSIRVGPYQYLRNPTLMPGQGVSWIEAVEDAARILNEIDSTTPQSHPEELDSDPISSEHEHSSEE